MNSKTKKLTHSALMIALALVLSMIKFIHMPNGGSITPASMAPIILISLMYDTKWGLFTSFAYSLVQMLEGFYPPPVQTFGNYILVILLDYVIAFGVLGLAGAFAKAFKNNKVLGASFATIAVIFCRYFSSFISGMIIWGSNCPDGTPLWLFSLSANGFLMVGEMITTTIVVSILVKFLPIHKMKAVAN